MSFALDLARRVNRLAIGAMPEEAIHVAKFCIADTLGVSLAGQDEPVVQIATRTLEIDRAPGPCFIFGSKARGTALDAALINGAAAHALDYDDCSTVMGGHPSAPVVPALLALAEEMGASGKVVLEAFICGIEAEVRLARGLLPHHYEKGWHPTSTLGVFGAAAACARLLKLDDEHLASALAIAVSLSNGLKANFGTPTKPLHVGTAARGGLMAALLARDGLSANPNAFEQEQGFFDVFNGQGNFNIDAMLADRDRALELLSPGVAIKQHPCCGSAHSAIDAAIKLRKTNDTLKAADIESIETQTHARRLAHTNRPDPRTGLDAKFSVQYTTARALMEGAIRFDHFEGDAFMDPAIRGLLSRTVSRPHNESNEYLGRVRVTLRNGTTLRSEAVTPFGRGQDNPMSTDELKDKFMDCAIRTKPAAVGGRAFDEVMMFDRLSDVRHLTAILAETAA